MADLVTIGGMRANNSSPLVHLYKSCVVFNHRALTLLGLTQESEETFVSIKHLKTHKDRVYVSAGRQGDYIVKRRCKRAVIYSTSLARTLSECLQGYGTYRICPDDVVYDDRDNTRTPHYAIFFRRLISMRA